MQPDHWSGLLALGPGGIIFQPLGPGGSYFNHLSSLSGAAWERMMISIDFSWALNTSQDALPHRDITEPLFSDTIGAYRFVQYSKVSLSQGLLMYRLVSIRIMESVLNSGVSSWVALSTFTFWGKEGEA